VVAGGISLQEWSGALVAVFSLEGRIEEWNSLVVAVFPL
jgi:hypothetical protein